MGKKVLNRLGTALRAFFDDAVRYCINIHLIHNDAVTTSLNSNEDISENGAEVFEAPVEYNEKSDNETAEQD